MANPTTATLAYSITVPDIVPAATAQARVSTVPLYASAANDPVLKVLFDCTVSSDVTAPDGKTRTVVLALGAGFFALFPNAQSWAHAFDDLFGRTLALLLPAQVVAQPVVFA